MGDRRKLRAWKFAERVEVKSVHASRGNRDDEYRNDSPRNSPWRILQALNDHFLSTFQRILDIQDIGMFVPDFFL